MGWLREDLRVSRKQRHTAKRVHERLVAERGFEGSYETVKVFWGETAECVCCYC